MEWNRFNYHSEAPTKAFEAMCNQLFELWCNRNYKEEIESFNVVNGSGGDGGVEAYTTLKNGDIIGVQSKWFRKVIEDKQINQIRNSINTAMEIRPNIKNYIVCVPRDLTSSKKTKNGKRGKGETDKWNQLTKEISEKYPLLKLKLWDESRIMKELQYPEAGGTCRYWFENTELSIEKIKYSFDNQEKGWLYNRYIPDIHGSGMINNEILKFAGLHEHRKSLIQKLEEGKEVIISFKKNLKDFFQVIYNKKIDSEIVNDLKEVVDELKNLYSKLNKAIPIIDKCVKLLQRGEKNFSLLKCMDLNCKYSLLRYFFDSNINSYKYKDIRCHLDDVKNSFYEFCAIDFYEIYREIYRYIESDKLIILGNAGTGKTDGAADSIKKILDNNYHVGILIQAKSISAESTWEEIILKTLSLGNKWDEVDIWSALEAISYRKEVELIEENKEVKVIPQIIICVDGIDESYPYSKWLERIRIIENITQYHKRIKFCITSRPYVFDKEKSKYNVLKISDEGDCDVDSIFYKYIKYYDLDINGKEWLMYGIKTPFTLRLFCECYRNKRYIDTQNVSTSVTRLLKERIKILEVEFSNKIKDDYCNEHYIHYAILRLANVFIDKRAISKDEMFDIFSKDYKLKNLSIKNREILINILVNNAILSSYQFEDENNLFSVPSTYYKFGIHSFSDYILALSINNDDDIKINENLKYRTGVLQMLSILLLENKNILISDCSSVCSELEEDLIKNLSYFSLANANPDTTKDHVDFLENMMQENKYSFNKCVNKVIIPVSRMKNHPLGALLLDKFLRNFETPIERDLYWSLPDKLVADYDFYMLDDNYVVLKDKIFKLNINDKFDGLPLIYGWSLTSVDNLKKEYCREELVKWGLKCPLEYFKLLKKLYNVNDQQLKEELVAISVNIVLSGNLKGDEIKAFANWVIDNIFMIGIIEKTYDAAIREYGRIIIEYAFKHKKIGEKELVLARPPYKKDDSLLKLDKGALRGTRMGGYKSITYDLSRYVLCDSLDSDFFSEHSHFNLKDGNDESSLEKQFTIEELKRYLKNETLKKESRSYLEKELEKLIQSEEEYNDLLMKMNYTEVKEEIKEREVDKLKSKFKDNINNFLNEHAKSLNVKAITSEQFIISAAYGYLIDVGLKADFDKIISNDYFPETHGSKSSVMTFTEKYIWCVKNILIGYLSDRIKFIRNNKLDYLYSYCSLVDYINPIEEIYYDNIKSKIIKNDMYIPENSLRNYIDTNDIKKWVEDNIEVDFEKWINSTSKLNKKYVPLSRYSCMDAFNGYGEINIWINSLLIRKDDLKLLLHDIDERKSYVVDKLKNGHDMIAYNECEFYITPREICCMDWIEEFESHINNTTIYNGRIINYKLLKCFSECTYKFEKEGEESYQIPSKFIRNLMGITNFRNNYYINDNNEKVASYYKAGDVYKNCTIILEVDKEKLLSALNDKDMYLLWIFHIMKQPTMKGKEKYSIYPRTDIYWIVWYSQGKINYHMLDKNYFD